MIVELDNACWSHGTNNWQQSVAELLVLLKQNEQHALLAAPDLMLQWCTQHLSLFVDYFKIRLASAQPRTNALTIRVSPTGANSVTGAPPWDLSAAAAREIVTRPLRLVLENNESDLRFVAATLTGFPNWKARGWVEPVMGGGSAMQAEIGSASTDAVKRWRTFFMFDSDRLHPSELASGWTPPGGDSCQGHKFEIACAAMPRERWHRLERRSIENYLPAQVLNPIKPTVTAALFGTSVGLMARFYNMKHGLQGDGVSPPDANRAARASRSQNFWNSLAPTDVAALEAGFGGTISREFQALPLNYSWPPDVIAEIDALAAGLQDAM